MTSQQIKSLIYLLLLLLITVQADAQSVLGSAVVPAAVYAEWGKLGQGHLVTSITVDHLERVWVGTEDTGVWMYDPKSRSVAKWTQFNAKSGLADDNCYALLCDFVGRIWVGTLNHGVSVYNGKTWKNYDVNDGPLGSRVFAIAESPINHDIWISTENGLSRYRFASGKWDYLTGASGLPSNQANALAFDKLGNLYVGSQCDGLGIGSATDDYKTWTIIPGPTRAPQNAGGSGLPSALINGIFVTQDDVAYVATDSGLARSTDKGKSWNYIRGNDWIAKVNGEYPAPDIDLPPVKNATLAEDYVTALCGDSSGRLWIGHRSRSIEIDTPTPFAFASKVSEDHVTSLCQISGGMLIGTYGNGLRFIGNPGLREAQQASSEATPHYAPFPTAASPPTVNELDVMTKTLSIPGTIIQPGEASYLGEDWNTQGDWIERYGRQFAILCADRSPFDHDVISDTRISKSAFIGPHHDGEDSLRYWVTWLRTDNPHCLYDPITGYRRQAEWDDHGEVYSTRAEGPDIWIALEIPEGVHRLSMYFFNKDGQSDQNRDRDYLIEIRPFFSDYNSEISREPLAKARVENFRGGVYKSFVLCGPSRYFVRINRNYSYNTIVSAVMVDALKRPPYWSDMDAGAWMGGVHYDPPNPDAMHLPNPHLLDVLLTGRVLLITQRFSEDEQRSIISAKSLWDVLNAHYGSHGSSDLQQPFRLLAYRGIVASGAPAGLQANFRWYTNVWHSEDRSDFVKVMTHAHDELLENNPDMKQHQY